MAVTVEKVTIIADWEMLFHFFDGGGDIRLNNTAKQQDFGLSDFLPF